MTSNNPSSLVRKVISSYSRFDKILITCLFIIALGAGAWIWRQNWLSNTIEKPITGGTYREGIVASSLSDVTPAINTLTKVGLTRVDDDGQIQPAAAESWQVSDDDKVYTFQLKSGLDSSKIQHALEENDQLFPDIEFEVDQSEVVFRLKQAFSPFLSTTTEPIFPYGPYQIDEQKKGEISFIPRADALNKPFLSKIIIRVYLDSFNLTQALADGEVDGVANTNDIENINLAAGLNSWTIDLPRRIYLFFNTEDDLLNSSDTRRRLNNGDALDEPIEITVTTLANPHHEALAADIANNWSKLGAKVKVETYTASDLANDIVPQRKYQLLIYGLDFGGDPDPYPFWHSSQIGEEGLNLSNFANIDADRLLEKARQSNDANERKDLYKQFDDIFNKEVPAIELEQIKSTFGTDPKIKGVRPIVGLSSADRFKYVYEWYEQTGRFPN